MFGKKNDKPKRYHHLVWYQQGPCKTAMPPHEPDDWFVYEEVRINEKWVRTFVRMKTKSMEEARAESERINRTEDFQKVDGEP